MAIEIADELFDIAEGLDGKRLYRFAEQLRGAGMSMSNNIAEGSGSFSNSENSKMKKCGTPLCSMPFPPYALHSAAIAMRHTLCTMPKNGSF